MQGFVYVPEYNDEALMEAIYSRGPVAVSLDASQPGFRFYSEGSPSCTILPQAALLHLASGAALLGLPGLLGSDSTEPWQLMRPVVWVLAAASILPLD